MTGSFTRLSDIWSFGILMWEIFSSGLLPYQGLSNKESTEKVLKGNNIMYTIYHCNRRKERKAQKNPQLLNSKEGLMVAAILMVFQSPFKKEHI